MTRNNILEETIRAGRPEPSATFTNRIRSTLTMLPSKRKVSVLRLLPAPAIVFAAVAAVCLVLFNPGILGGLFASGSGNQQAAGGNPSETAAQAATSPVPAENATVAPVSTQLPRFDSAAIASYTSNGFTETIMKAGTDGYVLNMDMDFTYPNDGNNYIVTVNAKIGGDTYRLIKAGGFAFKSFQESVMTLPLGGSKPLLETFEGETMHVDFTSVVETYPIADINIDSEAEIESASEIITGKPIDDPMMRMTSGKQVASFQYSLDIPLQKKMEIKTAVNGDSVCGFKAKLEHMYRSSVATTIVLSLEDNKVGDLKEYYDSMHPGPGSDGMILMQNDYYIREIYKTPVSTLVDAVDPDKADKQYQFYMQGMLVNDYTVLLEPASDGKMLMYLILAGYVGPERNSYSLPGNGFTIISSNYDYEQGVSHECKLDYYYIMLD